MEDYNNELLNDYINDEESFNDKTLKEPIIDKPFFEKTKNVNIKEVKKEKISTFQKRSIKKIGKKDITPKLKKTHNLSKSELRINRRINNNIDK